MKNCLIFFPHTQDTTHLLSAKNPEDTYLNPPNRQVKHFSAPTISVDRILERTMSLTKGKSSVVKPAAATAAG